MSHVTNSFSTPDGHGIVWTEHIPFNANEILNKKKTAPREIEKLGHDDARQERYFDDVDSFNQDQLTPTEIELLNPAVFYVNDRLTAIQRVSEDAKNNITKRMYQIGIYPNSDLDKNTNKQKNLISNDVEKLFSEWNRELTDAKLKFSDSLYESSLSLIGKDRQLRFFQVRNKLEHRDAIYPKSHILHFAFILAALVGEALLNAYFYSQGSDLGLLGGWLQALMVSAANVILSFIIGFVFLRYLNHISHFKKALAGIGFISSLLVLGFLHLAAAHYRELLVSVPNEAATLVLTKTMNSPFQLNDIDSFIMIIVGVGISIFIFFESYRYDDAYPGYGKEWRNWAQSEKNINYSNKDYRDETRKIMNEYQASLKPIENDIEKKLQLFIEDEHGFLAYKKNINSHIKTTVNECTRICNFYRKGFNAIAGHEALIHGDELYNIVKNLLFTKSLDQELDIIADVINSNKHMYVASIENMRENLNTKLDEIKEFESKMISTETEANMRNEAKKKAKVRRSEFENLT